jgi:hypothetical protein
MQLAVSVYYNQDVTKKKEKDKRHHDLITALREVLHLTGTYIPSLLPLWTGGALPQRMPKRGTAQETAAPCTGILPSLQR